jgi:hypothetical protein
MVNPRVFTVLLRRRLRNPRCLALVAMSEYARRQFLWQNRGYPVSSYSSASCTRSIYRGPALPGRAQAAVRDALPPLHRTAVHAQGGAALLNAHERLERLGIPVQTTVVSSLEWSRDDYVGPPDALYVHGNGVSGYSRRSSSVRRSRGRREMTMPSGSRATSTISGRDAMGSEPT